MPKNKSFYVVNIFKATCCYRQCWDQESFPSQSFLKGSGKTFVHKSFPSFPSLCFLFFLFFFISPGFCAPLHDDFFVSGLLPETHLSILEKAQRFKKKLSELLQVSISWSKPVVIKIQKKKTETVIEIKKKEILRTIYFYPKGTLKELELNREIVRLVFYELLLISPEKITRNSLWIPLWLVEGVSYNILEDRLVSPHFILESQRMKSVIPLESLLTRSIFFKDSEKNILFSFESASLAEYLFSLPFGESKLKKYLLLCQQNHDSPEALLLAFKNEIPSIPWLTKDWHAKAVTAFLKSRTLEKE